MAIKTWRPHPLDITIVEVLEKKGAMINTELFNLLRETRGELGFVDFSKTLMKMEVAGLIYVSSLTKGKRRVELVKARANSEFPLYQRLELLRPLVVKTSQH